MALTIKPIAAETTLNGSGNASNLSSSTHVVVINQDASNCHQITRNNASDVTLGSFTMAQSAMAVVVKERTDKLFASDAAIKFTAIAATGY